jgi:hypothetical protein
VARCPWVGCMVSPVAVSNARTYPRPCHNGAPNTHASVYRVVQWSSQESGCGTLVINICG